MKTEYREFRRQKTLTANPAVDLSNLPLQIQRVFRNKFLWNKSRVPLIFFQEESNLISWREREDSLLLHQHQPQYELIVIGRNSSRDLKELSSCSTVQEKQPLYFSCYSYQRNAQSEYRVSHRILQT